MTKIWVEIIAKFLTNQKVLRYMIDSKFELIKIFLIFLGRAHLTIKDQQSCKKLNFERKIIFYKKSKKH